MALLTDMLPSLIVEVAILAVALVAAVVTLAQFRCLDTCVI